MSQVYDFIERERFTWFIMQKVFSALKSPLVFLYSGIVLLQLSEEYTRERNIL